MTLQATFKKLASRPSIQIEGHCDEQGSSEYNLALGEKRAKAAQSYLVTLGYPADRIATISYGKERPADQGHDEAAWAKNRRDELKIVR
jgi:peptidoglycan-associated lipoprotein